MKIIHGFILAAVLGLLVLPCGARAQNKDGKLKTWVTAELLGAMRWAKAETGDRKQKLDFSSAEIICYKRLQKQIDAGLIDKGLALIIAENVRKKGVYRGDNLTPDKAEELRKTIVAGRIFEKLSD